MVAKEAGAASQKVKANKRGRDQSAAGKLRTKTAAKEKCLEIVLAEVFRAHWRTVNAKIARGIDVARNRAHLFFATNDRECLRMARRYYAPVRAAKLATASVDEILRLSEPWLSAARESDFFSEPGPLRKQLRKLLAAEYVALVWRPPTFDFQLPQNGWSCCSVFSLPDESVHYGDVYEITASGFSVGAGLRVCKTVAEPFLRSERREAEVGIEREFFENAQQSDYRSQEDAQWRVRFLEVTDRRAIDVGIEEVYDPETCEDALKRIAWVMKRCPKSKK